MKIANILIMLLLVTIFIVIELVNLFLGREMLLGDSMWLLWLIWLVLLGVVIYFLIIRQKLQKKYMDIAQEESIMPSLNLGKGEYFYQAPLYVVDQQPIKIYGENGLQYTTHFNNELQKWVSIIGLLPIFGVRVNSDNCKVDIKPTSFLSPRYKYNVYIDETFVGKFELKKLIKEKGAKQQLPYRFITTEKTFDFNNEYLSMETNIKETNSTNIILQGTRSFFDLSKDEKTNRRGEKHRLKVFSNEYPDELWLALYIQTMINKNG